MAVGYAREAICESDYLSVGVVAWGVWDYFHSEHPSRSAFGTALVGLVATILLLLRSAIDEVPDVDEVVTVPVVHSPWGRVRQRYQ